LSHEVDEEAVQETRSTPRQTDAYLRILKLAWPNGRSAAEIGAITGTENPAYVRKGLTELKRDGLVTDTVSGDRSGPGRPEKVWLLTQEGLNIASQEGPVD
jgi:predicted ArsR family transcriptional regulator